MIYSNYKELKLSKLGFGCMRLPVKENNEIDEIETEKMIDYAISNGVNYFDTAYPYHNGKSEIVVAEILKKYSRDKYYLATKYPGHQIQSNYDPESIFNEQLKKCDVDYFDFYLLHNVNESCFDVYTSEKYKIVEYFLKEKEKGRIKHLGFSSHANLECLEEFLKLYGDKMEFCQIQLNYVDWTLQKAKEKVELLNKYGIKIWVMEPLRGGKLSHHEENIENKLKSYRNDESISSWAFRWLIDIDGVTMILSGMSNFNQIEDNIKTFNNDKPLSSEEKKYILSVGKNAIKGVPCTSCEYCVKGCPMGLNIPLFMQTYNELKYIKNVNSSMHIEFLEENKLPKNCIECYKCARTCPQKIEIPKVIKELDALCNETVKWRDICAERELTAKKNRENLK